MVIFIAAIVFTLIFYVMAVYMTYAVTFILYKGLQYKLAMPTVKAAMFIILCYISIISDVIMFNSSLYIYITIKNGFLTALAVTSFIYAKS
jgi:hypothetical protein